MLIVTAVQTSHEAGVCCYRVRVLITKTVNGHMPTPIWEGTITGHRRSQGWPVLMGHIANAAGLQPDEFLRTMEAALDFADGDMATCPVCGRALKVVHK